MMASFHSAAALCTHFDQAANPIFILRPLYHSGHVQQRDARLQAPYKEGVLRPFPFTRNRSRRFPCRIEAANFRGTLANALNTFRVSPLDREIAFIALPTLATLAADPIASLVDTAYIGHLGAAQLAGVGISLSIYATVTKLFNISLLAVTTSNVATVVGESGGSRVRVGQAASSAIFLAVLVGGLQAVGLSILGHSALSLWGISESSNIWSHAYEFLQVRALGSPATAALLVSQGIFRGLGDTKTPLKATIACNVVNLVLDPILLFGLGWGVRGAAGATVFAELLAAGSLIYMLARRYPLPLMGPLARENLADLLKPTGLLALRTLAISGTFAAAMSVAARTDAVHAAAYQICLQTWLTSSLLADSLAVAAQSLLARALAAGDRQTAQAVANRTVQLGLGLGVALAFVLAAGEGAISQAFTSDPAVLACVVGLYPWVFATQPLNALAFVWDGILYGANGFEYAANVMPICAGTAVACMMAASQAGASADARLSGVWLGLATLMAMRSITIYLPYQRQQWPFDKMFKAD